MKSVRMPLLLLLVAATISIAAGPRAPEPPPNRAIEPEAERLLRAMTTYLASLQTFTVESAAVDEVVLASGQKIQLASESLVSVQRPNRLRSEQVGDTGRMGFWYDGKKMTLACKGDNRYATVPAPRTIDATIDRIRKEYRIDAPGADLLYSHPYEVLTEQVIAGRYVGRETVDSVTTNHLAFEGEAVDWQIWIQDGSQPLPVRFVVTTKGIKGQPQFTVRLSRWSPGIKVPPTIFEYEAGTGARQVQLLPVDCRGPQGSPETPPSIPPQVTGASR